MSSLITAGIAGLGLKIASKILSPMKAEQFAKPIGYVALVIIIVGVIIVSGWLFNNCISNKKIEQTRTEILEAKSKTSEAQRELEDVREAFDKGALVDAEATIKTAENKVIEAEKNEIKVAKTNASEFPDDWEETKRKWCSKPEHKGDCE